MDKRIYICAAIILILALFALLAYNNLEIYQRKENTLPSREVLANNYLALEKWLNETGHPVRIERDYNPEKISAIQEKAALVFARACDWENTEKLLSWIEQGNSLVICLNYYNSDEMDEHLAKFLSDMGINIEITSVYGENQIEDFPNFNLRVHFLIDDDTEVTTIKDNEGCTRLAEISPGRGKFTVVGFPVFMNNSYLNREINAALTWNLTGARTNEDNPGILFVRERERSVPRTLFGKLMERGNLIPLIVSALLVIFLGFWMVIPVFGLVFEEKQKNSRPIRERFAAEISFLKKHKALDYYLEIYNRELQTGNDLQLTQKYSYRKIINKLRELNDGTVKFKRRNGGI